MKYLLGFLRFWYDFIVGDCWHIGAGVVIVLACGAGLTHWQVLDSREIGPVVGLGLVLVVVASLLLTAREGAH